MLGKQVVRLILRPDSLRVSLVSWDGASIGVFNDPWLCDVRDGRDERPEFVRFSY
ncbi:hypothetical protein V6Z11_D13G277900 [Gossypium hirsutum]